MTKAEDITINYNIDQRELKRYKHLATALLGVMVVLTLLTYIAPVAGWIQENIWLEILRAGAYAGVVGGVADWFAVVALFRKPMGLPIPHTAIIPTQKNRLGRALGLFVTEHVFTEQEIRSVLHRIDLPNAIANILDDKNVQKTIAVSLVQVMPQMLDYMESDRVSHKLQRFLLHLIDNDNFILVLVKLLRNLVDNHKHEEVLSYLLKYMKENIHASEGALRAVIQERVYEQGGRLVGWVIGESIATRVLASVLRELDRIDIEESSLRENFTHWLRAQIDRLETDPSQARALTQNIVEVLSHEKVVGWWRHIGQRFRKIVVSDLENPQGKIVLAIQGSLEYFVQKMRHDALLREQIDRHVQSIVLYMLPHIRQRMAEFITRVIEGWDAVAMADKLELRVGKDLQFIRFSGTFIGFAVGAVLFAVLHAIFGINVE